jgi:uncharacterized protein YoxC
MNLLHILWLLVALLVLVVAIYWIQALRQLRRTLETVERLAGSFDKQLVPLLGELEETAGHLKSLTAQVDGGMNSVSRAFDAVGRTADRISDLGIIFKESVNPQAILLASILVGIQAGVKRLVSTSR